MNAPAAVSTRALSPSALAVLSSLQALVVASNGARAHAPGSRALAESARVDESTARRAVRDLVALELVRVVSEGRKNVPAVLEVTAAGIAFDAGQVAGQPPGMPWGRGGLRPLDFSPQSESQSLSLSPRTETKTDDSRPAPRILGVDLWREHVSPEWVRVAVVARAILFTLPRRPHPDTFRQWPPERVREAAHSLAWSLADPGKFALMEPGAVFIASCKNPQKKLRDLSNCAAEVFLREFVEKAGHELPAFMAEGYGELLHELGFRPRAASAPLVHRDVKPANVIPAGPRAGDENAPASRLKALQDESRRYRGRVPDGWDVAAQASAACDATKTLEDGKAWLRREAERGGWKEGTA